MFVILLFYLQLQLDQFNNTKNIIKECILPKVSLESGILLRSDESTI